MISDLFKPTKLKCSYRVNPKGITEKNPHFSWISHSVRQNSYQRAFRIIISSTLKNLDSCEGDIWDSGKFISSQSNQILYQGKPLISNTDYFWKVKVWDDADTESCWSDPADFSTGLYYTREWQAQWISHNFSERENKSISFQPGIDKWIWHPLKDPENRFNNVVLQRDFRIEKIGKIESAKIIVTADEKFSLFLNENLIAKSDDKIYSWARPVTIDIKNLLKGSENSFSVIGSNSYVEDPGFILRAEIRYDSGKIVSIVTDESWLSKFELSTEKLKPVRVAASAGEKRWRLPHSGLDFNPATYFRKTFRINKTITRAVVYAAALGLYSLKINGRQTGTSALSPLWSDFNKRVYYKTYDVTDILSSVNENVMNLILADGYYSGYCGWEKGRSYYGEFPAFILQLVINYDDGSSEIICSDETWESSEGPVREADILMGEFYDSNYEYLIKDWDLPDCQNIHFIKARIIRGISPELTSYNSAEVRQRFEIKPVSIRKLSENKFIADFGQNFAGYVRLSRDHPVEKSISLKFAEVLNPDGTIYTDNIRMARSCDTFIADNKKTWEPLFTFHGFRYVEITGPEKVNLNTLTGISVNSLDEQTGFFESSNRKLNKLFNSIMWSQRSNYLDIPADSPQRDERLGWTGDAVTFFKTAAFNYDIAAFYSKWFIDLFDAQTESGSLPPYAPMVKLSVGPIFYDAAGWADAGIISPYYFYEAYNDSDILREYYERIKLFIGNLLRKADNYIMPDYGYGDWLSREQPASKSYISTAYLAYDVFLMGEISKILGYQSDADNFGQLFSKIKTAFQNEFVGPGSKLKSKTQTAAVLALKFKLLDGPAKENAISFLLDDIKNHNYHVTAGFLGLSFLFPVLSEIGREDIAWKILTNDDFPSWFFMLDNGATTMWERWDSFHPDQGFNDPVMNSFNHCSLGSIGEWLYSGLAGIKMTEPGFKKFMIRPFIPRELTFVRAAFNSIYGRIRSEWEKQGCDIVMSIEIPFNTTAQVELPSSNFRLKTDYRIIDNPEKRTIIELGPGEYIITISQAEV